MKTTIVLMLGLLTGGVLYCQPAGKFVDKTWVRVLEESINDSVILFGEDVSDLYLKFRFCNDTVYVSESPDGEDESPYKMSGNILDMKNFGGYYITGINDTQLILEGNVSEPDFMKRTRMVFREQSCLMDDFLKKGQVEVQGDTLIHANQVIHPTFSVGTFYAFLNWYLPEYYAKNENGTLSFHMLFDPDGRMIECKLSGNENLSGKFAEKVRKVVAATAKLWSIPSYRKRFYYDLDICIWFPKENEMLVQQAWPQYFVSLCKPPDTERNSEINKHMKEGVKYLNEMNYDSSLEEFNKCLKLNASHPENIYYGRAYAYYRLNRKDQACSDWALLTGMGQRYAGKLYSVHCRQTGIPAKGVTDTIK